MKLPGYDGPMPPETMRDILAYENALAKLMAKVVFVEDNL